MLIPLSVYVENKITTQAMNEAHVDAVMILGEALRYEEPFDFGTQDMTRRITRIIPIMLENRGIPPPEQVCGKCYSQ